MIIEYTKDKRWQCFPTAFAMLHLHEDLGAIGSQILTPKRVMELIGHDGSAITHAGLPEPLKRRGFHIQEIIDVAIYLGYAMIEIQHSPQIVSKPWKSTMEHTTLTKPIKIKEGDDASRRFKRHIDESRGILSTRQKSGQSHAWAYENGIIYDPDGNYSPIKFNEVILATLGHFPFVLWRLDRIAD